MGTQINTDSIRYHITRKIRKGETSRTGCRFAKEN